MRRHSPQYGSYPVPCQRKVHNPSSCMITRSLELPCHRLRIFQPSCIKRNSNITQFVRSFGPRNQSFPGPLHPWWGNDWPGGFTDISRSGKGARGELTPRETGQSRKVRSLATFLWRWHPARLASLAEPRAYCAVGREYSLVFRFCIAFSIW